MDYLDLQNGTSYQTYTGKFYSEFPRTVGIDQTPTLADITPYKTFMYEPIENSKQYAQSTANTINRGAEDCSIRTKVALFLSGKGFCLLQDGNFYQIVSATMDRRNVSRQAAQYMPIPLGADFIVSLKKIENPFIVERPNETSAIHVNSDDEGIPNIYTITQTLGNRAIADASNPTQISFMPVKLKFTADQSFTPSPSVPYDWEKDGESYVPLFEFAKAYFNTPNISPFTIPSLRTVGEDIGKAYGWFAQGDVIVHEGTISYKIDGGSAITETDLDATPIANYTNEVEIEYTVDIESSNFVEEHTFRFKVKILSPTQYVLREPTVTNASYTKTPMINGYTVKLYNPTGNVTISVEAVGVR